VNTTPLPCPVCWRIHPDDAARFAAEGKHCETRRCRNPIAMVTWRYWRSAAAGRVLVVEHLVCVQHGREFADRHGIEIEPHPPEPSRGRDAPGLQGDRDAGDQPEGRP
jgi:hypothetical protein